MVAEVPGPSPMTVVDGDGADLDTRGAGRAEVAALVARARVNGACTVRTAHPRAARRAAATIDAIVAARTPVDAQSDEGEGLGRAAVPVQGAADPLADGSA